LVGTLPPSGGRAPRTPHDGAAAADAITLVHAIVTLGFESLVPR
jgi:hypothetical protein